MGKHSKSNDDKKKPEENKPDQNKFSGFIKKRAPIYAVLIAVFIIFLIPELTQRDLESVTSSELTGNDNLAVDLVKSYDGPNDKGLKLFDALSDQIKDDYPNEKIFEHKDTKAEFFVIEKSEQQVYEVHFTFFSHKENREYIWNVNIATDEVIPENPDAKKITNIVNYYD